MKDLFTPYDIALALKELGFHEECFKMYHHKLLKDSYSLSAIEAIQEREKDHDTYLAPTYSQAFRWFREKYGLLCYISSRTTYTGETLYIGNGRTIPDTIKNGFIVDNIKYDPKKTYREAELACLRKLIDIVLKRH